MKGKTIPRNQSQSWHMVGNNEWQITKKIINKFDSVKLDGDFFTFKQNVTKE